MYILQNDKLKIAVNKIGAELCQISAVKNTNEFMWDANPDVWANYAPNLFPIIGALKDNCYHFEGKTYQLIKHGFVRYNKDMILHKQNHNTLTFKLSYNSDTLKSYPFKFEFFITYKLTDNSVDIIHTIINRDDKTMYFSLGGHPAFKCPIYDEEHYDDYVLEFEHPEIAKRHLINMESGLISPKTKAVFNNSNNIPLTHELFNYDALVFKDLTSRQITLKSSTYGDILTVRYKDFPYLGIWAKPSGNYVCIEPWLGIADSETTNQNLITKEGILKLDANKTFTASYSIEIHNKNLD